MTGWRRAALLFLGLLGVSMVTTRFQVVAPAAVTAGVAPVNRVFLQGARNLRQAYVTLVEERNLAARYHELRAQNDVLRERNEQLQREVSRLRQVESIRATQAPNVVGIAQVVAVDPSPLLSRLTVNRGAANGVRVRMPVTVPAGLIGQVVNVSAQEAVVLALTDPESRIGVTLARNRGGRGIAVGQPPDRLKARFSLNVPVKVGDALVTNSLGGVFPVGIRVGTVEKVLPLGPNDVMRTVVVKPAVDASVVEDVTVLGGL
ncbi:rod shape-determining protein MreC [Deinococcus maricopensis]|uniref:Cell shape-determining protein MreC n=1 Tax=Deinococcus maricopensis (strain DSM 21211 / LMG 22137 / NRRL B-23946 / LB-34) TaxID=709986 RepID=E8UAC1_DEIML|nr:rod shape-determining protein MreC [Deinococcus maricopensis]ADV68010.1 Rod shape-determining protein MreC [Deinococcus maricopensis DSM 21211]